MPIIDNYRHYVRRTIGYTGWNWLIIQAMVPLPWLIQAPRLFGGKIGLGSVAQTAAAFGTIQDSLSFFRNAYSQFASYNAAIIRLHGLMEANQRARELPLLPTESSAEDAVAKTLELDPQQPQTKAYTLIYLGKLAAASGEPEQAVKYLQDALKVEGAPDKVRAEAQKTLAQVQKQ